MTYKSLLKSVVLLSLLTGCGGEKEPTEANFAKAITRYLAEDSATCFNMASQGGSFPITVTRVDLQQQKAMPTGIANEMVALEKVRLATGQDVDDVPHYTKMEKGKRYQLTDEGKKYYKQGNAKFCYGTKVLTKIIAFAAYHNATDRFNVQYEYTVNNIPEWANTESMHTAFPYRTGEAGKAMAGLTLHKEGWEAFGGGF